MPQITFTLTQTNLDKLIDATCFRFNYTGDNGETKAQFAKRMWIERMKETVKNYDRVKMIEAQNLATEQITNIDIT